MRKRVLCKLLPCAVLVLSIAFAAFVSPSFKKADGFAERQSAAIAVGENSVLSGVEGSNDLNAIKTDGGVFFEDFEKGEQSALTANIESAYASMLSYVTGNDAIEGEKSLAIQFGVGGNSTVRLTHLSNYMKGGKYIITVDLKLLEGTGDDKFCLGVGNAATGQSVTDKNFDLHDLEIGSTKKLELEAILDEGNYYIHLFSMNLNNVMKFALDNFRIEYHTTIAMENYIPTETETESGYTWNQADSCMKIQNGELVEKSSVPELAETDLPTRVVHLKSQSVSFFYGTEGVFKTGRRYNISFDYYLVNISGPIQPRIAYTTGHTIAGVDASESVDTVHTYSATFFAQKGDEIFDFYTNGSFEMYIGEITLREVYAGEAPATDIEFADIVPGNIKLDEKGKRCKYDFTADDAQISRIQSPSQAERVANDGVMGECLKITYADASKNPVLIFKQLALGEFKYIVTLDVKFLSEFVPKQAAAGLQGERNIDCVRNVADFDKDENGVVHMRFEMTGDKSACRRLAFYFISEAGGEVCFLLDNVEIKTVKTVLC